MWAKMHWEKRLYQQKRKLKVKEGRHHDSYKGEHMERRPSAGEAL